MASKQDRTFARTAMDIERKYNFDKSFSEAMNLAEQAKRQADEAYSVATNIKGIFFFIRYSAYSDGTNMTAEPQADTVYMGTCSTNVDEAPTDKGAYTWTKILGNDGANGEKGEKGEDGAKGDDGVGVSNMVAQFAVTNSKTTKPTSGWSTTMPNWTTGSYLWIRHIVYYTNGDEVPTEPMCDSSWEAVNVLNDTLNHEEVFKRLTNNGTQQGIYKDKKGDIYINGEYVEFEGATIGGWKIDKNALWKKVTINGTQYCVYFQPPVEGYDKTWILSCQKQGSDGAFYGNFILYSDGSAKFGSTNIDADGLVTLKGDLYSDSQSSGALNMRNSNIYGVNAIYMADASENASEGIHFYRSSGVVDSLYAKSGSLYFTPNRTCGTSGTDYTVIHSGNIGSQSVNSATTAKKLKIEDSRDIDYTPVECRYHGQSIFADFKYAGTIGAHDGTYATLMSIVPWSDSSGGKVTQLAFCDSGLVQLRKGDSYLWDKWISLEGIVKSSFVSGTSNDWHYIKFISGLAFCWRNSGTMFTNFSSTWGSWYVHDYLFPARRFPFDFVEIPQVFASPAPAGSVGCDFSLYSDGGATTQYTPRYSAFRPATVSATVWLSIDLFAIGRWK